MNKSEIDKLFLNLSMSKYLKKPVSIIGDELCSELLYSLYYRLSFLNYKVTNPIPFCSDVDGNGTFVPDFLIYNISENSNYGRFGVEHFKVSGCNYKNRKNKYVSSVAQFEHSLKSSSYNTASYSTCDAEVYNFYESFEEKYEHHYNRISKYIEEAGKPESLLHMACGTDCPIWFLIECDDVIFVDSFGHITSMFDDKIIDIITGIGTENLHGFIIYDFWGLTIISIRHDGHLILPYNKAKPQFRDLQYHKAKNKHWYLKMNGYSKFVC